MGTKEASCTLDSSSSYLLDFALRNLFTAGFPSQSTVRIPVCNQALVHPQSQSHRRRVLWASGLLTSSSGSGAVTLLSSGTAEPWSWRLWFYKKKSPIGEMWLNLPACQLRRVFCALHFIRVTGNTKGKHIKLFHCSLKASGNALCHPLSWIRKTRFKGWNDLLEQATRPLNSRTVSIICVTCICIDVFMWRSVRIQI